MRSLLLLLSLGVLPGVAFAQETIKQTTPDVRIDTNMGSFVIQLNPERSPLTVKDFLHYVSEGHYSGTIFHRVIAGFIIQGGGYTKDYKLKPTDQNVFNESGNGLSNLRGTVGLARASPPHSGNAQFYVNLANNGNLDPRPTRWGYTVFGKVIKGMDVVDKIGDQATGAAGPFDKDVPAQTVVIRDAVLLPH